MVDMVDWAELNHDLLVLVAERIEKIEDFVSFASVCTTWRAAAGKNNFKGLRLWQRIPCLMLPMTGESDVIRRFYSLLDDKIVAEVSLPNFKGKRCIESLGWYLSSGQDGEHSLLNPFTGYEIPLPHQTTFPHYHSIGMDGYIFMEKMVLSARPDETSDCILMVICGGRSELAFWRPGDENWTCIETRRAAYKDVTFCDGKFYAIDAQGFVVVCNPAGSNPTKGRILARVVKNKSAGLSSLWYDKLLFLTDKYIVKSLDRLLVIIRTAREDREVGLRYNTKKFQVFQVNRRTGTWKRTKNLGDTAVFLGHSATTALEASKLPGIKGNHVYFTDDCWDVYYQSEEEIGGKDIGMYNLKTGDIERFCPQGQLHSRICSSIWVVPRF